MTEIIVEPATQPLKAWQYVDYATAPAWVTKDCFFNGNGLVHDRQSGRQIVDRGDWLVRSLDGEVGFYTDVEFNKMFRRVK